MLFLFFVDLALHVWSCPALCLCVSCPFSILITLLGEEGAGLCSYRACFVSYAYICVTFSLPPGIGDWLQLLLVALSRLFCLHSCHTMNLFKK